MSEETTETIEETETKDVPKQLREALKRSNDENAKLREQVMAKAFTDLGLDPTTGLGKAVSQVYDGDTSFEALAKFALEEYGHEAPAAPENAEQAAAVLSGQAQLDAASTGAGSVTPPTQQDQLATAEAEGDYDTAMRIKGQRIAGWFEGGPE